MPKFIVWIGKNTFLFLNRKNKQIFNFFELLSLFNIRFLILLKTIHYVIIL